MQGHTGAGTFPIMSVGSMCRRNIIYFSGFFIKRCQLRSYSNSESLRWHRLNVVLATLCLTGLSCSALASDNQWPINWPLGRSGSDRVLLKVPVGFATQDRAAKAMNGAVYGPGGPRNINAQVHADLLLTALWPGLVPDNGANHGEFNLPGGGRVMMAQIHSGAIEDYEHRHYNALQ